jgi:hypothetical protein
VKNKKASSRKTTKTENHRATKVQYPETEAKMAMVFLLFESLIFGGKS